MNATVASLLGYDVTHVAALPKVQQRVLGIVALSAVPGIAVVTASAAYGSMLIADSMLVGALAGLAAGLYLTNLIRMTTAGGGVAAHQPARLAVRWAPRAVPVLMLAVMGAFFAQPIAVWWLSSEHDADIRDLASSLSQMHESAVLKPALEALAESKAGLAQAQSKLESVQKRDVEPSQTARAKRDVEDAERHVSRWASAVTEIRDNDVAVYRAHLMQSKFVVHRIQLAWAHPQEPLVISLLMMVLLMLPWLVSGSAAMSAHRAYELRRWAATRALVEVAYEASRALEADALAVYPTFTGLRREPFADAPYNTMPLKVRRHGHR